MVCTVQELENKYTEKVLGNQTKLPNGFTPRRLKESVTEKTLESVADTSILVVFFFLYFIPLSSKTSFSDFYIPGTKSYHIL